MDVVARILLTSFTVLLGFFSGFSQINPDSLGLDDNPKLTEMESRYFNIQVQHYRGDFDFHGKKLGLFMEDNGKKMVNKQEYFDNWAREHFRTKDFGKNQLLILTPEETELSNGYDAIIVSWSEKKITDERRHQLAKKLRKFKRMSEAGQNPF